MLSHLVISGGTAADGLLSQTLQSMLSLSRHERELLLNQRDPYGIGGVTEEAKGQMTIFYSGKVNVYDDVSADKARALLQLAASPLQFPQEAPFDGHVSQAPSINAGTDLSVMVSPVLQTVRMTDNYRLHKEESRMLREENSVEGSGSRKASVQRYLEKRKDRYKSKRKVGAPACGTFDGYLNHQNQIDNHNHNQNERSSRSATCSPPPIRPPNTPNRFS